MRILLASYSSLKTKGGWFYGTAQKLHNGFVRAGHGVEFFSDRDIARSASILRSRWLGKRKVNRLFKDYVLNYDPHLIVLCHADLIDGETLLDIRAQYPSKRIVEVRVDALHNTLTIPHMRRRIGAVHHSFLTTAGRALSLISSSQSPASFIPNPVDRGIEMGDAHLRDSQDFDAIYSRRPTHEMKAQDYRLETVREIERNAAFKVFSIGVHGGKQTFGQAYFNLITNAKIGLNLSLKAAMPIEGVATHELMQCYSSDRIAHYGGNGLVVMTPKEFGFDEIMKDGTEFLSFESPQDARTKVEWLVANPSERMAIARAGHKAFHTRFSSQKVAEFIVAKAFEKAIPSDLCWPSKTYVG
jgi:Glycosyl transferases group 1